MKFSGGIHPKYQKVTAELAIETLPLLERYVVPIVQHLGAPGHRPCKQRPGARRDPFRR